MFALRSLLFAGQQDVDQLKQREAKMKTLTVPLLRKKQPKPPTVFVALKPLNVTSLAMQGAELQLPQQQPT